MQEEIKQEEIVIKDELSNIEAIEQSLHAATIVIKERITIGKLKRIKSRQVIGFPLELHKDTQDLHIDAVKMQLDETLPKLSRAMDDCNIIKGKAEAIKKALEERRPYTDEKLLEFEAKAIHAVADIDKVVHDVARRVSKARSYTCSVKFKSETKNPENQFSYMTRDEYKEITSEFATPILGAAKMIADLRVKIAELYELEKNVMN